MRDDSNQILLSAVVVWEVVIKRALGKLVAPPEFVESILDGGALALPISLEHAAAVGNLQCHHKDPFDRILVAQALVEGAAVVTKDAAFGPYDVRVVW